MKERSPLQLLLADAWFLCAMLAIGLALRLDLLIATDFRIDADEGIVGLMGKHFIERGSLPAFYYGQHYMGSFEALLAAGSFLLFGISAPALKLVPLAFSLLLIVLIYLLAQRMAGRSAARCAALLTAVPPAMLLLWSGKARGGFIELLCIGALALLCSARWLERPRLRTTLLLGLLLGFGWWVNNQIIYFVMPIALWMAIALRRDLAALCLHAFAGLAAFLVGGLPFWLYNIRHGFVTFRMFGASRPADVLAHAQGLFDTALPIILGARRYWQTEDLYAGASLIMWLLYAGLSLALLYSRRRALSRLLRLEIDAGQPVELLIALVFSVAAVYSLSSFGELAKDPRYLLPIYVGAVPLAAAGVACIARLSRLLAGAVLAALLCFNLLSLFYGGRAVPGEPHVHAGQRVSAEHEDLIRWLDLHGIRWVRTNYWIGYRLAFETGERVRFVLFNEPGQVRIKEYEDLAPPLPTLPLILVPRQSEMVRTALHTLGYRFRLAEVSGYEVVYEIQPEQDGLRPIPASELRSEAALNPDAAPKAYDDDPATRWGSGVPQQPGMSYALALAEPRRVRALRYDLGKFWHDYPRALRIEIERPDGTRHELCSPAAFEAVRYFLWRMTEYFFYIRPTEVRRVILTEEGRDEVFDWSIAELDLYE